MNSTPQQTQSKPLRRRHPFECLPETDSRELTHSPEHMPSVYHLHPTPSQPQFGVITPPVSPGRRFVSPHAHLTEAEMEGTTCSCGHSMFTGKGCCPACWDRQQARHHRVSAQNAPLTPPPSNPTSPRESLERGRPPVMVPHKARAISAVDAFNNAFASEDEQPSIFPSSFNRPPRRASPRGSMSATTPALPGRTRTIKHSQDHVSPVVVQLVRPNTPDSGHEGTAIRKYSPMAEGFARLGRKEAQSSQADARGRATAGRGSVDLSARMFGGPA